MSSHNQMVNGKHVSISLADTMGRIHLNDIVLELIDAAIGNATPDQTEWFEELLADAVTAIAAGARFEQGIYDELERQGYDRSDFEAGVWPV